MPKKLAEKVIKPPKQIDEYLFYNHEKLDRVINGSVGKGGQMVGGLGKGASTSAILAEYDHLGGLIMTKDGKKVATGSFWDFENRCPRTSPVVEIAEPINVSGTPQITTEKVDDSTPTRGKKKKIIEE